MRPDPSRVSGPSARAVRIRTWTLRLALLAVLAFTLRLLFPPRLPDVLVLVMDTTRADRCSVLGYTRPTTPQLERVAHEAVVFERAWSPAPWTVPAHAALFTGQNPNRVGITDSEDLRVLGPDAPTLAAVLSKSDYATACFTNNAWIAPHTGLTTGFQTIENVYASPGGGTAAEAHKRALAWMRARRREGRRYFAFINDMEPHAPWSPSPEFTKQFVSPDHSENALKKARTLSVPKTFGAVIGRETICASVGKAASELYDGEVASLDKEVGLLLDAMRAEGMLDDTLVVITSDHGEGLNDHGWWEHGLDLHREVLRVPLLVRLPGGTDARRVDDLVRLEDIYPTVLRLCGREAPEGIDGLDLLHDDVSGRVQISGDRWREHWLREFERVYGPGSSKPLHRRTRSVADGRYHVVVDDLGNVRLYDVRNDPHERQDLAGAMPEVAQRLMRLLPEM